MNDKEYLDHVHKEGVELLQELKRACSVWNIPYTIIGGTMIGAIRDKGFIPWDNDIDVVMTRENYLQFLKIPDSFFSSGIHINCLQKIKKYKFCSAQLRKDDSENGAWIDIFPFEFIDDPNEVTKKMKRRNYWLGAYERHYTPYGGYLSSDGLAIRKNTGIKAVISKIIPGFYLKFWKLRPVSKKRNGKILFDPNYPYDNDGRFFPKDLLSNLIEVPFENIAVSCYAGYDKVLRKSFGNYLVPPPPEKRHCDHTRIDRFR